MKDSYLKIRVIFLPNNVAFELLQFFFLLVAWCLDFKSCYSPSICFITQKTVGTCGTIEDLCSVPFHCSSEWKEYKMPQIQAPLFCYNNDQKNFKEKKSQIYPSTCLSYLSAIFVTMIQNRMKAKYYITNT